MKLFRFIIALGCLLGIATAPQAQQSCNTNIAASTPSAEFSDHGDGTVTHIRTGLMWKRCAEGQTWSGATCSGSASTSTWASALKSAVNATTAGYRDWRLPNVKELASIVEEKCERPSINESIFPKTPESYFWSASIFPYSPPCPWIVDFSNANVSCANSSEFSQVRLVRSGQSVGSFDALGEQTPPERLDLPVDSTTAPGPGHKAVVMTHGWQSDVSIWALDMANDLCANGKLGVLVSTTSPFYLDNRLSKMCQVRAPDAVLWDVWILDWRKDAGTPTPWQAYAKAFDGGETLATSLKANNYSHIHFIAHSAGANLIDVATNSLISWVTTEHRPPLEIHATFLDAYHPFRNASVYGKQADWTDNYVDTRDIGDLFNGLDGSRLFLKNGYSINVTPNLLPGEINDPCLLVPIATGDPLGTVKCRHNRPVRFYGLSLDPNFVGDAASANADKITGTGGMGYPLSVENGHSLRTLNNAYPKNAKCVMDGNTCYPGSLPPSFSTFLLGPVGGAVVESIVGTITSVAGVGTTLFNVIRFGAGLFGGASVAPMTAAASVATTESPSSFVVLATTTQPANTLRFNWRFAAAGEGFLRLYVDGNLVREIDQRHVALASSAAEEVYIGGADGMLPAGTHRIAIRLDGFGASASGVELTNVELGLGVHEDFLTAGTLPTGWVQPTGSNAPWAVAGDAAYAGTLSLKSGAIADNQKSELSYTTNLPAGNVSFARKVSSELNFDFLQFYIDGVLQNSWSGELDWALVSFPVSAGTHTLLWRYVKNGSVSAGTDGAWIDSVLLPGTVANYTLTVAKSGAGSGTVTSSPTGIDCGSACTASYASGTSVTLTNTPTAGSTFTGWSGACTGTGSCTVSMTAAQNVTAAFSIAPPSTRLVNLSTRGQVLTGDNVMIGGFVIVGTTPKKMLIRAVGPNLANYGIAGVLADPTLQLFSGSTAIASNNDWGAASNAAEIQATGLAPANSKESAILTTLNPGAYTAVVSGLSNGTGVGIVEVYELDNPASQFTNISTRGQVLTGDNVMIGGFVIQGTTSKTVLIRAVGPNLANYGVTGVLANPTLQLFSGSTAIASNDDWGSAANAAAIQATGLAPVEPKESAILITLQPGAYTAVVSGVAGGTGVGIVEVFAQ